MSKHRKFTTQEKDYIYNRDNGTCAYCGHPVSRADMTMRHRMPISRGGTNAFDNLDLSCWQCSHMIGNMTFNEFTEKAEEILKIR